jgi:hypothetical protein
MVAESWMDRCYSIYHCGCNDFRCNTKDEGKMKLQDYTREPPFPRDVMDFDIKGFKYKILIHHSILSRSGACTIRIENEFGSTLEKTEDLFRDDPRKLIRIIAHDLRNELYLKDFEKYRESILLKASEKMIAIPLNNRE